VLSEASYSDFSTIDSDDDVIKALIDESFSPTQAAEFVSHWRVADHIPNTSSGFSATVFERKDNLGQYTLAIRGTEPFTQWITDLTLADIADVGADGIALNQAIDLYNYYQQLITEKGKQAVQYEVYEGILPPPEDAEYIQLNTGSGLLSAPEYLYLRVSSPADGLGVIPEGHTIDVTGHSLGGHLALILSRLDPNRIDAVHTYNAPGFDTGIIGSNDTEWFFSAMAQVETAATGSTTVGSVFPESKIQNMVVPEDLVSDIGTLPGGVIEHFSEVDTSTELHFGLTAHLISRAVDSLAVLNTLAAIDTTIELASLTSVMKASSVQTENSLESMVQSVAELFAVPVILTTDNREQLHHIISCTHRSSGAFPEEPQKDVGSIRYGARNQRDRCDQSGGDGSG